MKTENTSPRYIPPGSCTWCGHPPHESRCAGTIRVGQAATAACTCGHSTTVPSNVKSGATR